MSENKDFEIIKELTDNLKDLDIVLDKYDLAEKVIAAASRMAAENKQYKEITERLAASGNNLGMALIELKTEIERLKAELAKRPEVVRCGECKEYEWCRKSINKDGHGDMCPLSYCSAGVRRESEENNEI